jgi:hypothetical protein
MECANRACSHCVRREFTAHPNAEAGPPLDHQEAHAHHHHHHHSYEPETFLLLHQIYCLKNGRPTRAFLHGLHHHRRRKAHAKKLKPIAGAGANSSSADTQRA